ncbi:hypothetical protein EDE15_2802 [Edaphobacter aggregans]|jgi:hypothetical protein|uniref:DUF4440 domain-containing protein n=1 Tax=Edaphobacter aggregans TaxID=570835 RepID=A0A3R9R3T3_9BACT|nr:DUF4440 domain-containing protein [Edaphobacter aggregans]RSL17272.1 hypothetical protein EDE15_2802 [Edaphobacter aggregans]
MTKAQLQDHLHSLEERLLHPDREPDRRALSNLLAEDFQEFCTSGRIFNLQQLTSALQNSSPRAATMSYFYVTPLADDVALATYHITTANSTSHHSSIWVQRNNRWQLLFHQGTIAA